MTTKTNGTKKRQIIGKYFILIFSRHFSFSNPFKASISFLLLSFLKENHSSFFYHFLSLFFLLSFFFFSFFLSFFFLLLSPSFFLLSSFSFLLLPLSPRVWWGRTWACWGVSGWAPRTPPRQHGCWGDTSARERAWRTTFTLWV